MDSGYAIVEEAEFELAIEDFRAYAAIIDSGGGEELSTTEHELELHRSSTGAAPKSENTVQLSSAQIATDEIENVSVPSRTPSAQSLATEENDERFPLKEIASEQSTRNLLPPVDIHSSTKMQCLFAIFFGIASSLACVICGIAFYYAAKNEWCTNYGEDPSNPPSTTQYFCSGFVVYHIPKGVSGEAISFVVNMVLTQCLEGLAYVHSISLRWALLQENRLKFNTNIRLFTSSRHSQSNSWYANAVSAAFLILCYAATSVLFLPHMSSGNHTVMLYLGTYINVVALWALGIALSGQTLLAIWCYYNNLLHIPSWSSNPLNTTVTMLRQQLVQRRAGRCMLSVQTLDSSERRPIFPRTSQPSQWQIIPSVRKVAVFAWILVGLALIWFIALVIVTRLNMTGQINFLAWDGHNGNTSSYNKWHFILSWNSAENPSLVQVSDFYNAIYFGLNPGGNVAATMIAGILIIFALQGLQTLGLHCAELIVNISRDEDVWRGLNAESHSHRNRHVLSTPAYPEALMTWKYSMLFVFKSALHWLLGQSAQPSFDYSFVQGGNDEGGDGFFFTMNYSRLFVYVICAMAFASFITFLAVTKPKGPQPATYGHIQTIADVIDDWTMDENGCFWWGDKGDKDEIRHAGMSSRKRDLGRISMDILYAG